MAKKISTVFKLEIQAGGASPAPPIGPIFGQQMLNIMQFVKEYNAPNGFSKWRSACRGNRLHR